MSTFLEDYLTFVEPLEVPTEFHIWCALSTLAAAAGRKCWLDLGLVLIIPNLYVVLVSMPGKCGKSTAMGKAQELVGRVAAIRTKSDSITKEKMYVEMSECTAPAELRNHPRIKTLLHSSLTIYANEMSVFIKNKDKDFVGALNSLFDCKPVHRDSTKGKGTYEIVNPFLNLLGCTTPDWLAENIHEDVIEGGLSARAILVFSDDVSKINPNPMITPQGTIAFNRMVAKLEEISQIGGLFARQPDAIKFYEEWYYAHHVAPPRNYKMTGYHYRKRIHLNKIAMLMSLSRSSDLIITKEDYERAMAILKETEPLIEKALQGVGKNILSAATQEALDWLAKAGSIPLEVFVARFSQKLREQEIEEVLRTLRKMGYMRMDQDMGKDKDGNDMIKGTIKYIGGK